jgi:hypothetical protein
MMGREVQRLSHDFVSTSYWSRRRRGRIFERVTNYLKKSGSEISLAMDFPFASSTIPVELRAVQPM